MGFGGEGEGPSVGDQTFFEGGLGEAAAELARVVPADHDGRECFSVIAFGVFAHEVFPLRFSDGGVGDEETGGKGGEDLGFVIGAACFVSGASHEELARGTPFEIQIWECGTVCRAVDGALRERDEGAT